MTHTVHMDLPIRPDRTDDGFEDYAGLSPIDWYERANAALFPPTVPACLAAPARTARKPPADSWAAERLADYDAAILRAHGAPEDTFDVSPPVPRP